MEGVGDRWRRVPILQWLPAYERRWLRGDLVAGGVVAALAVPQALGYAALAGAPVQVGLYAVPVALVAYAILGSSRELVVGPVSTVAVLSGSLLASFGVAGTPEAAAYTAAMAIAAGLVLVVSGFLRIGWVAEFLSKPIITGFVLGLTLLVVLAEIPHLLGVPVPVGQVVERVGALGGSAGEVDPLTLAVSVAALAVLFGGRHWAPGVPWGLLVLVGGLVGSSVLDLAGRGVAVVGDVPNGVPAPSLPGVPVAEAGALLGAGVALAFVGLAEGLSAARLFAVKGGYRVDADQELLASGAANIAAGLFGGLGVAGSLSKTAAAVDARCRTQVAGLSAAAVSLVALVAIAPVLSDLPRAVLSAIVVNAVWKLMDFSALRRYARVRRNDITAALVAAVGVLAFGPLNGLLLAVAQSVLGLVYRSSRTDVEVMGKVPGEKAAWGGVRDHPERHTLPGILVLRVDSPIFWVNAAPVHDEILAKVDAAPGIRVLILDLEATNQIDTTSADGLETLHRQLNERGIDLYLVRVMWDVRKTLRRSGTMQLIGEDHVWHSISQGVREARHHHDLKHLTGPGAPAGTGHVVEAELEAAADEPPGEERIAPRTSHAGEQ
ncbi:MAG TPA: sulfate permease [Jiangellales bacterium]|nr:sulfate permease [Jiangellales bacterium]